MPNFTNNTGITRKTGWHFMLSKLYLLSVIFPAPSPPSIPWHCFPQWHNLQTCTLKHLVYAPQSVLACYTSPANFNICSYLSEAYSCSASKKTCTFAESQVAFPYSQHSVTTTFFQSSYYFSIEHQVFQLSLYSMHSDKILYGFFFHLCVLY
jgi:hypothetical protein